MNMSIETWVSLFAFVLCGSLIGYAAAEIRRAAQDDRDDKKAERRARLYRLIEDKLHMFEKTLVDKYALKERPKKKGPS